MDQARPPMPRGAALARALLGWLALCVGVGLAITLARLVGSWTGGGAAVVPIVQAVLVSCLVVPAIVLLRRRLDRRPLRGIGLSVPWTGAAGVAITVTLATAALVWVPALVVGWIRVEQVDPITLLGFLAVNTIVLLLYEALPEEVALRGYAWSTVSDAWAPVVATVLVTVLFSMSSALISVVQTASASVLGAGSSGISLTPPGSPPIEYLLQIIVFGLALVAARRLPLPGALAAAIVFHVVQLTVNRVLLGGLGWIDSGVDVTFVAPDAVALVLVHIALSGLVFVLLRRRRTRGRTDRRSAA